MRCIPIASSPLDLEVDSLIVGAAIFFAVQCCSVNWAQLIDSLIVGAATFFCSASFFCSAVLLCELGSTRRLLNSRRRRRHFFLQCSAALWTGLNSKSDSCWTVRNSVGDPLEPASGPGYRCWTNYTYQKLWIITTRHYDATTMRTDQLAQAIIFAIYIPDEDRAYDWYAAVVRNAHSKISYSRKTR